MRVKENLSIILEMFSAQKGAARASASFSRSTFAKRNANKLMSNKRANATSAATTSSSTTTPMRVGSSNLLRSKMAQEEPVIARRMRRNATAVRTCSALTQRVVLDLVLFGSLDDDGT